MKNPKNKSSRAEAGFAHVMLFLVLVFVCAVIAFAGYTVYKQHSTTSTKPLQHVTVQLNWLNNAQYTGLYTAVQKGYYKAAGLEVSFKEVGTDTDPLQEIDKGTADYAISTPLEVVLARDKGETVTAVAAMEQTSPYAIASRAEANIKTPADFAGKVLGGSGGNPEAAVTYAVLLTSAGLKPSDATIKNVDFDVVKVFQDKQSDTVDLYRTDQPYLYKQQNIAYNLIYPEDFGFNIYGDVLAATDSKIAKNKDQVAAFVQASMKGWGYAIDHQSEALGYVAKYQNSLYKDAAYERYILSNMAPLIKPSGGHVLGAMQYIPWNRAYQGVQAAGLLKHPYDATKLYTSKFIE